MEYEGVKEPLKSETVEESVCDIDNVFGKYGFKNRAGEFVTEPRYTYVREFTNGLSAVNLGRTYMMRKREKILMESSVSSIIKADYLSFPPREESVVQNLSKYL